MPSTPIHISERSQHYLKRYVEAGKAQSLDEALEQILAKSEELDTEAAMQKLDSMLLAAVESNDFERGDEAFWTALRTEARQRL